MATPGQTTGIMAVLLGIFAVVAIIALVLASMAYAQTSGRAARRDAIFYALSQNPVRVPGGGSVGTVLLTQPINLTVLPGETMTLTDLVLDTSVLTPAEASNMNKRLSLVTTARLVTTETSAAVEARATISFINYTSTIIMTAATPVVDNVLLFRLGDVADGQPHSVICTNT